MSLAPGPGDLGGPVDTREPCQACDGADTDRLCDDCLELIAEPLTAVCLLRNCEHALASLERSYESALRRARGTV